jgi:hypothetical protein
MGTKAVAGIAKIGYHHTMDARRRARCQSPYWASTAMIRWSRTWRCPPRQRAVVKRTPIRETSPAQRHTSSGATERRGSGRRRALASGAGRRFGAWL